MNKLVRTLTVIFVGFAVSSLLVYKFRLSTSLQQSQPGRPSPRLVEETKTVEGQIHTIDPGASTLTLVNDGEEVIVAFDERTAILESGRAVKPTSITSGRPATVKYTQRGAKKWARSIDLVAAEPPDAINSY